jgi:PAS domain S-box-containing protein
MINSDAPIPEKTTLEELAQKIKALEQSEIERIKAQRELQRANDIISQSPAVAFIWKNAEGWPVEYVSENVHTIFGWNRNDFTGGNIVYAKVVHPDDLSRVAGEVIHASVDKSVKTVSHTPYRIIAKDGSVKWVEDFTTILRAEDGEVDAYQGIILDITDRKSVQEQLHLTQLSVDGAAEGISWIDSEGRIIYVNDSECKRLGYTPEEFVNLSVFNISPFITPENWPKRWTYLRQRGALTFETQHRTKNGELVPVQVSANYVRHNEKEFGFIFNRDITESKRTETEQKNLQAKLANAMEMAQLAPWEYDVTTDVFTFNDHFYKIYRTTAKEVGGYTMTSSEYGRRFVHPDDLQQVMAEIRLIVETTDPNFSRQLEHRILYADGSVGYITVRYFIVKDALGQTITSHGVNQDITDRKRSEEALQKSEMLLRTLIRTLPDLVWLKDPQGTYLFCNSRFERFFGAKEADIIGKTDYDFLAKDLADFFRKHDHLAMIKGSPSRNEEEVIFADDGHHEILETIKTPMYRTDGELIGVLGIGRDITERKRAEAALRESEEKLGRSRKMESMGLLAGGVAHDLNNILSGIVSYPDLLLMDLPEDSRLRKPIKTMQECGQKAAAIVQDLLTIARGVAIEKQPLNLNDIIENYLASPEHQKLLQYHSAVRIEVDLDPHLLNIKGSPVHVGKTIMNLVSNAAEAINGNGKVRLTTTNRYMDRPLKGYDDVTIGEYAVLGVADDGPGILPDDLERIFEPFYSRKVMGRSGTGLGLAVVWNVLRDHKGYINVLTEGGGATFELYFPVTRDELWIKDKPLSIKEYMGNGETVLVVDDEKNQREILCKMLDILDYKAIAVPSGEKAVAFLKDNSVELILLDMIMAPGMNGRQTFERIITLYPKQKAVIVSGFAETQDVRIAQQLGAGRYLKKPIQLEKLGLAIKAELAK